ncbi:MAG: radical SAM protein [Candidatus Omnitrophota bacterium]
MKITNFLLKARYLFCLLVVEKFFKFPYHCHFQVTRRCNFQCESCCVWRAAEGQKELDLAQIEEAACQLQKIGVKSIVLTGGEPLLRKDICAIITIFKHKSFIVRLQTNGYLLTEGLAKEMLEAGLDDLYVSFDSLDVAHFMKINGVTQPRAFEDVYQHIKAAAGLVKKYGAGMFLLTVVRPSNMGEVEALYKFAQELDCLIAFYGLEVVSSTHPSSIRAVDRQLVPSSQEREALKKTFIRIKGLKNEKNSRIFMSERLLDDFINFYSSDCSDMHWPCHAGERYLELLSDGQVAVCNGCAPMEGYQYNNLIDLYKRKDKKKFFQSYIKKCEGCICTRQLEYLVDDFSDIMKKAAQYFKATIWK